MASGSANSPQFFVGANGKMIREAVQGGCCRPQSQSADGYCLFTFFEENPRVAVERHFEEALKHFFSTERAMEANQTKNVTDTRLLPMKQRNLPASFWCPPETDAIQLNKVHHGHTTFTGMVPYTVNQVMTTGRPRTTTRPVQRQDLPDSDPAPLLVSCRRLPVTSTDVIGTIAHAQSKQQARYMTIVHGPRPGDGFNPRYNSLLVQPNVFVELPRVHGEPRSKSG
ncbi:uncharacterized protein LOC5516135 [Nematostella vectensis]|uniref:uncharacterized protein LOC5516135 n=1 Tax=Nematostella vectensis TaxID=45351 RepID=UPI00207733EA|nr:uncharacterized protein LOC5516135 [Nematostella vectensis]